MKKRRKKKKEEKRRKKKKKRKANPHDPANVLVGVDNAGLVGSQGASLDDWEIHRALGAALVKEAIELCCDFKANSV